MFGSQLGSGTVQGFSAASLAILIYAATDRNGNNVADPGELDELLTWTGVDPENPGSGVNFNRVDPGPEVAEDPRARGRPRSRAGAELRRSARRVTWRRFNDVIWSGVDLTTGNTIYPLVGVTRADYVQEGVAAGNAAPLGAYSQAYFAPRAESLPVGNGGEYRNRPDYHQRYLGLEVQATKRMSNRWMGRVGFSTNTHREYFDDPSTAVQDPTPSTTWPNIEGGAYVTQTNGSGKSEIYLLLPRYQFTAGGAYQLPYRINVAGSLVAREGLRPAVLRHRGIGRPVLPEKRVLLADPDDNRLPGVFTLDLRAEKALRVPRLEPDADARHVQRDELVDDARPPVRRDRDRRDRVQQDAGDHEPAADQAGGAVPVLISAGGRVLHSATFAVTLRSCPRRLRRATALRPPGRDDDTTTRRKSIL